MTIDPTKPRTLTARGVAAFVAQAVLSGLAWLVVWSLVPLLVGWTPQVVLSGSMVPAVMPGDVVVIGSPQLDRVAAGQVVWFSDPTRADRTLLHRIEEVNDDGTLTTKGDANPTADSTAIAPADLDGQARLRVPWVGLPAYWAQERDFAALTAMAAVLLLLLALARTPASGTGPSSRAGAHRLGRRSVAVPAVAISAALVASLAGSGTHAGFSGTTHGSGGLAATGTFPTYSAAVAADRPAFYHRSDEAFSTAATSTAVDSSTNNRPGRYHGATSGAYTHWEFSEGAGTTVADSSGGANPGTLLNGATWAPGQSGSGLAVDGVNDRVVSASASVQTDTSFSASVWAKVNSTTNPAVVMGQAGNLSSAYYIYQQAGKWNFGMTRSDTAGAVEDFITSTATVTPNRWALVTAVYDDPANQMRLYVDGALQGSLARPDAYEWRATGALGVGAVKLNNTWAYHWAGNVDDVRTYQRALTAAEISAMHAATTTAAAHWKMDEGTGTTAADSSGNNKTLTLASGASWATGASGNALSLNNSTTGFASAANAVATNTSFSVSAGVYLNSKVNTMTAVSQTGVNTSGFALRWDASNASWSFAIPTSDVAFPGIDSISTSTTATTALFTWVHLVGVYDAPAGAMRLYVQNGTPVSSGHTSAWNATGTVQVGRSLWNNVVGQAWNGRIDDVRLYDRALTAAEVSTIYNFGTLPSTQPGGATPAPLTAGMAGALQGPQQGQQASTAVAYNGTSNTVNLTFFVGPQTFTVEAWFKASGTSGGVITGFQNSVTGAGTQRDRVVYLDSGGRLTFGVNPNVVKTVRTAIAYNDAQWHHVVASLGPLGMRLHVDGVLVAQDAAVTSAEVFNGYWHWGGMSLQGWPNRPANDRLVGTLDELALFGAQLTDAQISRHYHANH